MNVEESKTMKVSKTTIRSTDCGRSKTMKNVEYINCLDNMVTNGARHGPTREIKHRIGTAKDSTRRLFLSANWT
jgi:hypothetical protein